MADEITTAIAGLVTTILVGAAVMLKRAISSLQQQPTQAQHDDQADQIASMRRLVEQLQTEVAAMAEAAKMAEEENAEFRDDMREQALDTQRRESLTAKAQRDMVEILGGIKHTLDQMLAAQTK